jgi:phage terminase large subunit
MTKLNIRMLPTFRDFFQRNEQVRMKVLYGGSSSGKTYAATQWAIIRALNEPNQRTLIIMETYPGIKMSMFLPMIDMLERLGIQYQAAYSVPFEVRFQNGHLIRFISADKPGKAKYLDDICRLIINEATEINDENLKQLENRIGRTSKNPEFIYTFNPIDEHHPLIQRFVIPFLHGVRDPNLAVLQTTYKDNWHNKQHYIEGLEARRERDPNFYRIYALGEPGHLEGLIYEEGRNWEQMPREEWPKLLQRPPDRVGIDFGYNDPTAVIGVWEVGNKWYAHQYLYDSGLTQDDLMMRLYRIFADDRMQPTTPVYCDSAEPARIEDLRRGRIDPRIKGFNAQKSVKDVRLGIDRVKSKHLIVSEESRGMIKELRNYRWAQKEGSIRDEPLSGFLDHALDALRYAIATSLDKSPVARLVIEPAGMPYVSPYSRR